MRILGLLTLVTVLVAPGCGSDSTGPTKTFEGDGFSFSYPPAWEEREADAAAGSADVVIAPEPGRTVISVGTFESPEEITNENFDDFLGEIRSGAEQFLRENVQGSSLEGEVEQLTVAGRPAVAFDGSTDAGGGVHTRETWIFDRTTFYAINCQSPSDDRAAVDAVCDQVLDSFEPS